MSGRGSSARFLQRPLRAELVNLLSRLLTKSKDVDLHTGLQERGDGRLVARLHALGVLQPDGDAGDRARLTRQGRRDVEEALRLGIDKIFRRRSVPSYDRENKVLYWQSRVIRRWDREATSQDVLLLAFEEEDWAEAIDDPTPPDHRQDPKQRLRETVRSLNLKLKPGTIRFLTTRDGTAVR
jgi:hypothetical protein